MVAKRSICQWCNARCRVAVQVDEDNHLVSVAEDLDFPMDIWPTTRACVRRAAAKEFFYHPDRVNYPLKKTERTC